MASFSTDEMFNWYKKKLTQPALVIFGTGQVRHQPKGKGKAGGVGNGKTDKGGAAEHNKVLRRRCFQVHGDHRCPGREVFKGMQRG